MHGLCVAMQQQGKLVVCGAVENRVGGARVECCVHAGEAAARDMASQRHRAHARGRGGAAPGAQRGRLHARDDPVQAALQDHPVPLLHLHMRTRALSIPGIRRGTRL